MKVAVVGLGQMGLHYLRILKQLGVPAVGIDIDPAKVTAAQEKFPDVEVFDDLIGVCEPVPGDSYHDIQWSALSDVTAAIVATNTPSHHRVLIELMRHGIKHILCEKPLGMDLAAIDQVRNTIIATGAQVYTGLLMNFSPAILHVIEMMQSQGLVMTEGSMVWGKNRYGDKRPTPGDLEDETVHGVGILHALAGINQAIQGIRLSGRLTYPSFASAEAQAKAHVLDPSFPKEVNATTMALELIRTDRGEVPCSLHSSFIHGAQVRRMTAVLSRVDDPSQPVLSVEFNFDTKANGQIVDTVVITTLDGNQVEKLEFTCDKLGNQTAAFLQAAAGEGVDPRLTDFDAARSSAAITAAILASHQQGGEMVTAYTEADILPIIKAA